jgi:predicted transcriptional regulator
MSPTEATVEVVKAYLAYIGTRPPGDTFAPSSLPSLIESVHRTFSDLIRKVV